MGAAYSYDLRMKAIEAVKRGEQKSHVSRLLKISRNTLDLWIKREKETGSVRATERSPRGARKIKDQARFQEFVRENCDKTQGQMAELWGDDVTQQNISHTLKKLGITRKKNYGYRERNEEERIKFQEQLSKVEKSKIT